MKASVIPCVLLVSLAAPAAADGPTVTVDEVLSMMTRVPGRPGDPRSVAYRWDKKKGAPAVARAIAATAPTRTWAARMVVYAIHESGLQLDPCASGDGGKSLGPWQLGGVREEVACDPAKAAPVWLTMARTSAQDCVKLPPDEAMAELVSGSCGQGRQLSRRREVLTLGALSP
jgi:hypothetical protein